ncbi:hypothetical protein I3400192H8_09680 [Dialister sp. i34-0019-2H8]
MCIKGKIRDPDLATIVRKAEKSESFRRKAEADPTGCKDTTFTDFPLVHLKALIFISKPCNHLKSSTPFPWGTAFY